MHSQLLFKSSCLDDTTSKGVDFICRLEPKCDVDCNCTFSVPPHYVLIRPVNVRAALRQICFS